MKENILCGFAGASSRKINAKTAQSVARMARSVAHRGPDGDGVYKSTQCHIAHRRLSIIDAQGGHQPLISTAGNMIAFNGMINNFLELRKELPDAEFETKSDTEVVLKLYEQHGDKFVEKIRGMYALAIWDKGRDTLILARDPYGIKPLYYCERDGVVYFASEPHAFWDAGLLPPQLATQKAIELLQLKFTTGRQTVYEGIYRVLPGEMLFVQYGKIIRRERQNPFAATSKTRTNYNDAYKRLDEHLVETAELYARSIPVLSLPRFEKAVCRTICAIRHTFPAQHFLTRPIPRNRSPRPRGFRTYVSP
jgi:asparagine synthase (glutamine-hydrolysing)